MDAWRSAGFRIVRYVHQTVRPTEMAPATEVRTYYMDRNHCALFLNSVVGSVMIAFSSRQQKQLLNCKVMRIR